MGLPQQHDLQTSLLARCKDHAMGMALLKVLEQKMHLSCVGNCLVVTVVSHEDPSTRRIRNAAREAEMKNAVREAIRAFEIDEDPLAMLVERGKQPLRRYVKRQKIIRTGARSTSEAEFDLTHLKNSTQL